MKAIGERAGFSAFSLALVWLSWFRAAYLSSTGLQISGDGLVYASMARHLRLEGEAPFVFRPLLPFLVGWILPEHLLLGFLVACLGAQVAICWMVYRMLGGGPGAFMLAAILLGNYQILFNTSNVARLDTVVFAAALGLVLLALEGRRAAFLWLLPLLALLKESLLLAVLPVAWLAFGPGLGLAVSTAGFVGIHAAVRGTAVVTGGAEAYADGWLDPVASWSLLVDNVGNPLFALELIPALGGLALPVLWIVVRVVGHEALGHRLDERRSGEVRSYRGSPSPGSPAEAGALLRAVPAGFVTVAFVLPLLAATDLNRAWFELLLPIGLYVILDATDECTETPTGSEKREAPGGWGGAVQAWCDDPLLRSLSAALLAGAVPYLLEALGQDHLYLQILESRLTMAGWLATVVVLVLSALATRELIRSTPD